MVSTFSPNVQLEEPARGDDVGVWDSPVNSNMTLLDLIVGGNTSITLNNANVTLAAAQFQSKTITFVSTLTGSVTITFPTSFKKSYEIQHTCTGSSAFTITLATTAAGGQIICAAPGEIVDVINDGTNIKFKGLGRIGEYMTIAGSSVPNWITGCTIAPYLNCDGSPFSGVTFPALATRLNGTTLPDARGRTLYALEAGTGRVTVGISGISGNTLLAAGGDQSLQGHNHSNSLNDPGHTHSVNQPANPAANQTGGGAFPVVNAVSATNVGTNTTGITLTNASAGSGGAQNMPPLLVAGLTLIRAG